MASCNVNYTPYKCQKGNKTCMSVFTSKQTPFSRVSFKMQQNPHKEEGMGPGVDNTATDIAFQHLCAHDARSRPTYENIFLFTF